MNFRDATLVSIASDELRSDLFTESILADLAAAAYRIEPDSLTAPWAASFDRFELAPTFETHEQTQVRLNLDMTSGRGDGQLDRVSSDIPGTGPDAIWQGAIIGQGQIGGGRIAEVSGSFVGLGDVDAVIDQAGGIPAQGPARDTARLAEIAARLSAAAGQDDSISPQDVANWVAASGAADLTTFLGQTNQVDIGGGFGIRFVSDAPAVDSPIRLSLNAVIQIAEPDPNAANLVRMIRDTRHARELLAASRDLTPPTAGVDRRTEVVGLWFVPLTWFEDNGWPGANPAARRDAANIWLREMGIAIAAPN